MRRTEISERVNHDRRRLLGATAADSSIGDTMMNRRTLIGAAAASTALRKVQMRLARPHGGWAFVKRSEACGRTRRSWQRRLQVSVLAQYPSTVR